MKSINIFINSCKIYFYSIWKRPQLKRINKANNKELNVLPDLTFSLRPDITGKFQIVTLTDEND